MRRNYTLRFLFLTATCAVIIVGLHFYMYIYNRSSSDRNKVRIEEYPAAAVRSVEIDRRIMAQGAQQQAPQLLSIQMETEMEHDPRSSLKHKIVHLDLKGMPPTVSAYEVLFPMFAKLGVTGLLMEYEDMFPYQGRLEPISNKKAYSVKDIQKILALAKSNNLKVIPLIQTFGHLEFVLKLKEFEVLREVPRYMQVICPTNNDSQVVIKDMIDQVMELHPDVEYFHIGSDEVYHIGQCPLCIERMSKFKIEETQLFLQHATDIATHVKIKHNVQPLMWDDEFRKVNEMFIKQSGIGDLVEIVVWNYNPDVENHLSLAMWEKYSRIFKSAWIGSAFKGANKPNSAVVNETLYLANHYSWLQTMASVYKLVTFKGIILTGWQRYDHFSVLCELLPSAIPSLTSCMTLLTIPNILPMDEIIANASSTLKCGNLMSYCEFPGSTIHHEIQKLEYCKARFKKIEENHVFLGWAQEINLRYSFSNPSLIEPIFQEVNSIKMELDRSRVTLVQALQEMFPQWSVDEWMMTSFQSFYDKIQHTYNGLSKILDTQTFPRRPLDNEVQDV